MVEVNYVINVILLGSNLEYQVKIEEKFHVTLYPF
jgi:hypothetical protein